MALISVRRVGQIAIGFLVLLALLYALGNAEFRAPYLEGRLRAALEGTSQGLQFEAEDVFVQVVPWRGQVRLRLNQAQVTYDVAFNAPIRAEELRLDLPIWRLFRGDVRPSGLTIGGTQFQINLSDELSELVPSPDERRSAEDTWGFVFDPLWIEALQQTLPIYVFSDVRLEDAVFEVREPLGRFPLFEIRLKQASARTPFGLGTNLKGRTLRLDGKIQAPGGQGTDFAVDVLLQANQQFRAQVRTDTLIPSHYYRTLRLIGLKTPERLTTPYRINADLSLDPEHGHQTASVEIIEGLGADSRVVATSQAKADRQTQEFELITEFSKIDLQRLAPWTPVPAFLEELDLTTKGNLRFSWNKGTGDWLGEFELTQGSGTFAIPTIGLPSIPGEIVGVRSLSVKGIFDPMGISLSDMHVATGSLDQPGPVLVADLVARSSSTGPLMTLDLRSSALNQGDLFYLWPKSVATKTRDEIESFVTAGAFSDLSFTGVYRLSSQEGGGTRFQLEGQQLVADFEKAQVQLTPNLPPLVQADGRLALAGGKLDIEVSKANLGDMRLVDGHTSLDFSKPNWIALAVDSPLSGPLAPALKILAEGKIGLEGLANLPLDQIEASASGDLNFALAFNPQTVGEQGIERDHIKVDADLKIENLQVTDFLLGQGVQNGHLKLQISENSLAGVGEVVLDDLQGQITVHQTFASDAPTTLEIVVDTLVPGGKVQHFIPGFENFLSGTSQGQLIYRAEQGQDAYLSVDLDLTQLGIDFPALVYTKQAGQPGSLTLDLIFGANGSQYTQNLQLRGPDLRINAALDLPPEGWSNIRISSAQVNDNLLEGLRIENRGDFIWATVANGQLDLSSLLDQFTATAAESGSNIRSSGALGFSLGQPLVIDKAYFQQLNFSSGAHLKDARLSVVLNDDGLRGYTLNAAVPSNEADVPGGRLDSRLVQRDDKFALSLHADNLGALMNALGMSSEVRGGQFALTGESIYPLGGGPWALQGGATTDVRIYNVSPLVGIMSLISLTGILEQMSGSGLIISDFDFTGTLDAQRLDIDRLKVGGPSLGLTVSGDLNWSAGSVNLRGAIALFNLVNQIVEGIPLIGELLTGANKEGLIATQFNIQGSTSNPDIQVDALSTIQPGLLRSIIDGIEGF